MLLGVASFDRLLLLQVNESRLSRFTFASLVCPSTLTSYLYTQGARLCGRATGGIYAANIRALVCTYIAACDTYAHSLSSAESLSLCVRFSACIYPIISILDINARSRERIRIRESFSIEPIVIFSATF